MSVNCNSTNLSSIGTLTATTVDANSLRVGSDRMAMMAKNGSSNSYTISHPTCGDWQPFIVEVNASACDGNSNYTGSRILKQSFRKYLNNVGGTFTMLSYASTNSPSALAPPTITITSNASQNSVTVSVTSSGVRVCSDVKVTAYCGINSIS